MAAETIFLRIHEVSEFVSGLSLESLVGGDEKVEELFGLLRRGTEAERSVAEERLWKLWCAHRDPDATQSMVTVISVMGAGDFGRAERILDELGGAWPDWAEVWNKRATLYFALGRYEESVRDVRRTLDLESRHFGALCGFAQIAHRHGDLHAARTSLEFALEIHPGLVGVSDAIESLRAQAVAALH